MIPFSDADTHFRLVRDHLDEMVRDAEEHRIVREVATGRPRRAGRWPRLLRSVRGGRHRPLVS